MNQLLAGHRCGNGKGDQQQGIAGVLSSQNGLERFSERAHQSKVHLRCQSCQQWLQETIHFLARLGEQLITIDCG